MFTNASRRSDRVPRILAAVAGVALAVTAAAVHAGAGPYAGDEAWFYGNGTTGRAPHTNTGPGLTWNGTAQYTLGVNVQAFSFDGTNGLVSDADTQLGDVGADDFIVQFTMNTTQTTVRAHVLSKRAACGAEPDFWSLRVIDGIFHAEFFTDVGNYDMFSTTPVNDGEWHTVTYQRVGDSVTVAIDGVVEDTSIVPAGEGIVSAAPLRVATGDPCIGSDATVPFVGAIDDLYIGPGPLVDFGLSQTDVPVVPAGGTGVLVMNLTSDPAVSDYNGSFALTAPAGVTFTGFPAEIDPTDCALVNGDTQLLCGIVPFDTGTLTIPIAVDPGATPGETLTGSSSFTNQEVPDPNNADNTDVPFSIQVAAEDPIPLASPLVAAPLVVAIGGAALLIRKRSRSDSAGAIG